MSVNNVEVIGQELLEHHWGYPIPEDAEKGPIALDRYPLNIFATGQSGRHVRSLGIENISRVDLDRETALTQQFRLIRDGRHRPAKRVGWREGWGNYGNSAAVLRLGVQRIWCLRYSNSYWI